MTQDGGEPINGASVAVSTEPTPEDDAVDAAQPAAPEEEVAGRNLWRRVLAIAVVLVAALAVVVLWARPAHEPAAPALRPPGQQPAVSGALNPTDFAFLQLMISLDTSALPLFDLLKDDPQLAGVVGPAATGHRDELAALRSALSSGGGIEDASVHAGHDLPGMVLEDDLAAVRAAPADQRKATAVRVLREHLEGTTRLATSEGTAGSDPAAKAAARLVLDAHTKLLQALPTV
ncbi:hypothetical protein ACPPVO_39790 [Dactylosporangium sp. McL0621]|uniref:hypothetical protein n=1 Tax=Dactylosporangium sp. McL0621 TaxID=3415678 RepID=UPI003CF8F45F